MRDRGDAALALGLPMIVSEWGGSDYSGGSNGLFFESEARILVDWMNQNNLSWVNWSFSNKDETCSALLPEARLIGPWDDADLTQSGRMIKDLLQGDAL